jgi:hypothetical protein
MRLFAAFRAVVTRDRAGGQVFRNKDPLAAPESWRKRVSQGLSGEFWARALRAVSGRQLLLWDTHGDSGEPAGQLSLGEVGDVDDV